MTGETARITHTPETTSTPPELSGDAMRRLGELAARGRARYPRGSSDLHLADPERQYADNMGHVVVLTREEEFEFGERMQLGREARARYERELAEGRIPHPELAAAMVSGQEAREAFIHANLPLALSIANNYRNTGQPILELIQDANHGLIRAIDKFDHTRGLKLSTFAEAEIRSAIQHGLNYRMHALKLSRGAAVLAVGFEKYRDEWSGHYQRGVPLTYEEMGWMYSPEELARIKQLKAAMRTPKAFTTASDWSDDSPFVGMEHFHGDPASLDEMERMEDRIAAQTLTDTLLSESELTNEEQAVIELVFLREEPLLMTEAAEKLGLGLDRVARLKRSAINKMQRLAIQKGLNENLALPPPDKEQEIIKDCPLTGNEQKLVEIVRDNLGSFKTIEDLAGELGMPINNFKRCCMAAERKIREYAMSLGYSMEFTGAVQIIEADYDQARTPLRELM